MGSEQRRFERKTLHVDFRGKDSEGTGQLHFEGADLSTGGTFIKSDLLLEQGDRLSLEFRVPGVPRLMRAQARVAWVRRFPDGAEPAGMGVEFLTMTDEDRAVLDQYLGAIPAGGAPP